MQKTKKVNNTTPSTNVVAKLELEEFIHSDFTDKSNAEITTEIQNALTSAGWLNIIYDDLRSKLQIDKSDLDGELLRTPILKLDVAEYLTVITCCRNLIKTIYEQLSAKLRNELASTNEKMTIARQNDIVTIRLGLIAKLMSEFLLIQDKWKDLLNAYNDKLSSLRHLCNLLTHGQFPDAGCWSNEE